MSYKIAQSTFLCHVFNFIIVHDVKIFVQSIYIFLHSPLSFEVRQNIMKRKNVRKTKIIKRKYGASTGGLFS